MTNNKYFIIFLISAIIIGAVSCEEKIEKTDAPILFGMESLNVTSKSALTQDDIDAVGTELYVYGTQNTSTSIFDKEPIKRNVNGIWYPQTTISPYQKWASGSYSFYGIASSEDLSSDNMGQKASSVSTPGIDVYNKGLGVVVNQPTSYNASAMIDYLLSKNYTVADGTTKPLVKLQMEHTLPSVEIYVIKAEAMYGACIKSITLSGVYSSATLTCTGHKTYGSSDLNIWNTALSGDQSASYNITGTLASQVAVTNSITDTEAKMQIISVPQQLSNYAVLSIEYWINERTSSTPDNYVLYSESFNLFGYTPITWASGHRIIYTLKVDSGIHLTGAIVRWVDVDYIEGTILPAL